MTRSADNSKDCPTACAASTGPIEFVPGYPPDLTTVVERIRGKLKADTIVRSDRKTCLLDTPDERLHRADLRLAVETPSNPRRTKTRTTRWKLRDDTGRDLAEATITLGSALALPRFADDLPPGPLRDMLLPVTQMRALLPWANLDIKETLVSLRDRDGKIRLRLKQTGGEAEICGIRHPIPVRLRIEPLKGYRANAEAIADRVRREFGWQDCDEDLMAGIRRIGMEAGATSASRAKAKPKLRLDPASSEHGSIVGLETPAGPAIRSILGQLLDTMESRRDGVISDIDSEFLHEFRVAVRRTRSALQQLGETIPEDALIRVREDFRWLGIETGPTRDLDVHILAFKAHCRAVSPDQAQALEPLGVHLAERKNHAHRALVGVLQSHRYGQLLRSWRDFLQQSDEAWLMTDAMRRPIADVVGARILKVHAKALREGARIRPETQAFVLHDLRKRMKKLRYMIDFIRNLYPKNYVRPIALKLKVLQQVLGDIQDLEIQTSALHEFGHDLADAGKATPGTLMAIGAWAEDLDRQRIDARARFAEAFAPFADKATTRAFRDTFSPKRRMHGIAEAEPSVTAEIAR